MTAEQLCEELDRARHAVTGTSRDLGQQLKPKSCLQRSVSKYPSRWIVFSAVAGLISALALGSPGKRRKNLRLKNGSSPASAPSRLTLGKILGITARNAFKLAQPAATQLIQKRLKKLVD
ncbi:MAG: hypothetical protein AAGD22_09345 [Verrucomicrobiota bacterium]